LDIHRPKIPEYYEAVPALPDRLWFRSCTTSFLLQGESVPLLVSLLPYLRGDLTVEQIQHEVDVPAGTLGPILEKLRENGILFDEELTDYHRLPPRYLESHQRQVAFFSRKIGYLDRYLPVRRLRDSSVVLVGLGALGTHVLQSLVCAGVGTISIIDDERITPADLVAGLCSEHDIGRLRTEAAAEGIARHAEDTHVEGYSVGLDHVQWTDLLGNADLVVSCSDNSASRTHRVLNRVCLQNSSMWLSARLGVDFAEVGPLVIPRKTACFACYELRASSNRDVSERHPSVENDREVPLEACGALPAFPQIAAGYVSVEVIRILTGYDQATTAGGVLSVDFTGYGNTMRRVFRVPNCPACGSR
jgi:bacteriocin biosynthesis cyclodehydratase domain-containing protein